MSIHEVTDYEIILWPILGEPSLIVFYYITYLPSYVLVIEMWDFVVVTSCRRFKFSVQFIVRANSHHYEFGWWLVFSNPREQAHIHLNSSWACLVMEKIAHMRSGTIQKRTNQMKACSLGLRSTETTIILLPSSFSSEEVTASPHFTQTAYGQPLTNKLATYISRGYLHCW